MNQTVRRAVGASLIILLVHLATSQGAYDGGESRVSRSPGTIVTHRDLIPPSSTPIEGIGNLFTVEAAIGDLDLDGHLDIVTPASYVQIDESGVIDAGGVFRSVAFGDGTGAFRDFLQLDVEQASLFVQVTHLDSDIFPDLLFCEWQKDSSGEFVPWAVILHGDEGAAFRRRSEWRVPESVMSILASDLNNDGHPDISVVHLDSESGRQAITTWKGRADGSIEEWQTSLSERKGMVLLSTCIALGDADSDGVSDIIAVGSRIHSLGPTQLLVAHGSESGAFRFVWHELVDGPRLPTDLEVGDFNGDSMLDVAIAFPFGVAAVVNDFLETGEQNSLDETAHALVLLQQAEGNWQELDIDTGVQAIGIDAADLNEDGYSDLVTYGALGGISISRGASIGPALEASVFATENPTPAVTNLIGDFTEDGQIDIGTQSPYGSVVVREGDGEGGLGPGWFMPPHDYAIPYGANLLAEPLDFDADGHLDVVYWSDYIGVAVSYGDGSGGFLVSRVVFPMEGVALDGACVADFNGDSISDIALAMGGVGPSGLSSSIILLPGHSDRSTEPIAITSHVCSEWIRSISRLRFDDDLFDDLLVSYVGPVSPLVLHCTSDGVFDMGVSLSMPYSGWFSVYDMEVGDFNADSQPDVLAQVSIEALREFMVLWLSADGNEYTPVPFYPAVYVGGAADLDGEGNLDFLGYEKNCDEDWLFMGDGSGSFTKVPTSRTLGLDADLNGDGFVDGISVFGPNVVVGLGSESGELSEVASFASQGHPISALVSERCVGDFDGDGRPDLAVVNGSWISILLNTFPESQ